MKRKSHSENPLPPAGAAPDQDCAVFDIFERMLALMHPNQDPRVFGNEIRSRFPNPNCIFNMNPYTWRGIGLTEYDILLFRNLTSLARYTALSRYGEDPKLCHLSLASPYLIYNFFGFSVEHSYLLCLNRQGYLKEKVLLQRGTENGTLFSLRATLQEVMRVQPSAVIMCHNHPRKTLRPSPEDIDCTLVMLHGLSSLRVPMLDHLIVAGKQVVSLRENGFLPESCWMRQFPEHWMLQDWFLEEEESMRKHSRKK